VVDIFKAMGRETEIGANKQAALCLPAIAPIEWSLSAKKVVNQKRQNLTQFGSRVVRRGAKRQGVVRL